MPSKLDRLRKMTVVVADTGDLEAVRRLTPEDCTTNPTLILKAAEHPASGEIVAEALHWGLRQNGTREGIVAAVCDRLAVSLGIELARIVPGRVSTEIDADLSFETEATLEKARALIAAYAERGIEPERLLVKIAATWEGVRAAEILQREGVDCNLTLLFSLEQAAISAKAGVFLISPFVGRILDWHLAAGEGPFTAENDPGIRSVRSIYRAYKAFGVSTRVMGASFRNIGQIEALAGCDRLTIAPALLDRLAADDGELPRRLSPEDGDDAPSLPELDEPAFRFALNENAMASDKLSEGIRLFVRDLRALRALVSRRMEEA